LNSGPETNQVVPTLVPSDAHVDSRDGEHEERSPTAETLLEAALVLFAARGYAGTSVRAITEAAGANLAAVTYHFGSKEALFEAVLESILVPVGREIRQAQQGPGSPLERIRGVVAALLRHMGRHPEYPRLMLQQLSSTGLPHPVVRRTISGSLGLLRSLVEEGQRDGAIRPGDPTLMAVSLMSQPVHMSVVARPLQEIAGIPGEADALIDRMAEHAADFAVRALEAREETNA
jgi:AcrR family transcriptional regulator